MTGRAAAKNLRMGDYALSVGCPDKPSAPGWRWVALTEVAEMATGHTPSRKHPEYWCDGNIPWVTTGDANPADGGVILDTCEKINQLGIDNSAAVLLPAGTVCLSRTGSIGYSVILGKPMATSQGLVNWICSKELNNWFLLYLFMAERRALLSFGEGTAHKTIYFPEAKAFHVCLPPRKQQDRIVARIEALFSDLDAGISALNRARKNLKRYRASVLRAAVNGSLTAKWRAQQTDVEPATQFVERILHQRRTNWEADQRAKAKASGRQLPKNWQTKYIEPELPDQNRIPSNSIPPGWTWSTVDAIAFVTKLAGFEYSKFVKYDPLGDLKVIKAENAGKNGFRRTAFSRVRSETVKSLERSRLNGGELLMVFVGAGVGQVAIVPDDEPYFLGPNIAMLRLQHGVAIPEYCELFFQSAVGRSLSMSFVKAVAQPSLSMGTIRQIPVLLPPVNEQWEIVQQVAEKVSLIDAAESAISRDIKRAARLRQSIFKQAFEGKLVPQVSDDETASVLNLARVALAKLSNGTSGITKDPRRRKAQQTD